MKKTVLVNGTFRSGSGAVNDYLSSRDDFYNPFGDNEFRIVSDPMGLQNLFTICYNNPGILSAAYAFEEFQTYITNLEKYIVYLSPGVRGKIYNKDLVKFTAEFISKVTKLNYYAMPHYSRVNFDFKDKIKYTLSLKLQNIIQNHNFKNIIVPKKKNIFIKEAKIYIKNIIQKATVNKYEKKNIVLNNAIDALNPIESSKFFYNPKIVIVTRDPRDIFSGMKIGKAAAAPNYDVNIFINWFKHFFDSKNFRSLLNNKKILEINFEKFVNNFDNENLKLCKFLQINKKFKFRKNSRFNIEKSMKNIGKSKKYLSKYEIRQIEKKLSKFLKW